MSMTKGTSWCQSTSTVVGVVVEEIGITTAAVTKAVGKAMQDGGDHVNKYATLRILFGRSKETIPADIERVVFNASQSAA